MGFLREHCYFLSAFACLWPQGQAGVAQGCLGGLGVSGPEKGECRVLECGRPPFPLCPRCCKLLTDLASRKPHTRHLQV